MLDGGLESEAIFMPSRLTVTNLTPEITILEPDGAVRRLRADATPHRARSGAEMTAHWDGGRLVVETRTPRGRVVESWSASPEPRRLEVLLQVAQGSGQATAVRRVFSSVERRATVAETPSRASLGALILHASRRDPSADAPVESAP